MTADPIHERVLLVEDDDTTATIVLSAVAQNASPRESRAAFSLSRVASLTEAQEALTTEEYGAILLDLYLPDSSGLDTVHAVLEAAPHIAVIVLTSAEDSDMALEAMRLGAQDYLFKGRIDGALIVRSLLYAISRNRAEARLRNAQQMEALGRLAGSVAHDFNNLLTIIIGNAETAQGAASLTGEVEESLGEIRHAAQRAASLTSRLLSLGRKQQFQPRLLDLGETVSGMSEMLRRVIGTDTAFRVSLPGEHMLVYADPLQIEQLVLNLVLNARDADPPPRRVSITVSSLSPDAEGAWHPRLGSGRYALLTVRDDGAVISQDALRRMYEPFAAAGASRSRADAASGLALSIVNGIVEQSGGSMLGESSTESGTIFSIALPIANDMHEASDLPAVAPVDTRDRDIILLVEDESSLRALARRILQRAGYHVVDAANGAEAIAAFDEQFEEIALLVTDVVMPGMRGSELAEQLGRRRAGLPVLFMSGYADDELVRRGVFPANMSLLKKPFSQEELLNDVRRLLVRRRAADGVGA